MASDMRSNGLEGATVALPVAGTNGTAQRLLAIRGEAVGLRRSRAAADQNKRAVEEAGHGERRDGYAPFCRRRREAGETRKV
jgi:hypothetical protein